MIRSVTIALCFAFGLIISFVKANTSTTAPTQALNCHFCPGGGQPNVPANSGIEAKYLNRIVREVANRLGDTVGNCWQFYHSGDMVVVEIPGPIRSWQITIGSVCIILTLSQLP